MKSLEAELHGSYLLEAELDLNPQFVDITEAILSKGREDRAQRKKQ